MFQKTWVRVLGFALVAILVLGAVGVVAYQAGYRVGVQAAQISAGGFGSRFWDNRQGDAPAVPSPFDGNSPRGQYDPQGGPRMFGGGQPGFERMPYHMGYFSYTQARFPFIDLFWPGVLLGLIVLGGLAFVLIRTYNKPAEPAPKASTTRRSK